MYLYGHNGQPYTDSLVRLVQYHLYGQNPCKGFVRGGGSKPSKFPSQSTQEFVRNGPAAGSFAEGEETAYEV